MLKEKIESIKKNVFVYHIIPFDSTGIYIAESKEDAFASISKDLWNDVDWNGLQNPSKENVENILEEMGLPVDIADKVLEQPRKPINIFNSVEIWTWEEYQEMQGFNVSSRLLEFIS